MLFISFLISHVPPAHSFFQKKSILINLAQNLVQLIFLTLTKFRPDVMCVVVWYPQCKYINNFRFFKNF